MPVCFIDEETEVQRGATTHQSSRGTEPQFKPRSVSPKPLSPCSAPTFSTHCGSGGCCPPQRSLPDVRPGFLLRHFGCREEFLEEQQLQEQQLVFFTTANLEAL